eukprot:429551_1
MTDTDLAISIFTILPIFLFPTISLYFYLKKTFGSNKQKVIEVVDSKINVCGLRIMLMVVCIIVIPLTIIYPQYFTFSWKDDVFQDIQNASIYENVVIIFGIIILFISDILVGWTLYHLGRMWTMLVSKVENPKLITTGPYKLARHPMYTSFIIYFIGFLIATQLWLICIVAIIHFSFAAIRIRKEERILISQFGNEYIQYMNARGAFCPCTICDCGLSQSERTNMYLSLSVDINDNSNATNYGSLK